MSYGKDFEKKFIVEHTSNSRNLERTARTMGIELRAAKYLEKKLCSTPTKITVIQHKSEDIKEILSKEKTYHKFTAKEISDVKLMIGYGHTPREVAEKLGLKEKSINDLLYRIDKLNQHSKISEAIESQVETTKELPIIKSSNKFDIQVNTEIIGEREIRITIKY